MGSQRPEGEHVEMRVENVGGIDEASLEISSGVTALVGENATNRTSLVQAIAAGLGADTYTLKSDADAGEVSLTVGGDTYTRNIRRDGDRVTTEGEPYLEEPDVAELYAVLLESNEIRRAVRRGGDLRDLILAPLDTEEIRAEIADCVDERREIDSELDRLDSVEAELSDLETKRRRTERRLETVLEDLDEKREALEAVDRDGGDRDGSAVQGDLDDALADLHETRSELERIRSNLASEQNSVESLRETRETIRDQYESLSVPDPVEIEAVEDRIDDLRGRKRSLDSTISELQRIIRFNTERVDGTEPTLDGLAVEDSPADRLDPAETTVTCWTCGSRVDRDSIERTTERLRDLREEQTRKRSEVVAKIDELTERRDELVARREEWDDLDARLTTLEDKIERGTQTIAEFEDRRDALEERVADLEATVESLQQTQQDELLDLQREVSELEFEADTLTERLRDIERDIADRKDELAAREDLEQRREELSDRLQDLRTRIDRVETEAVEAFNTHMDALLSELGYDNIDRIWLEPTETDLDHGRGTATETRFEVHVVREGDDGRAYEDSLDHLSESERELVGLVVALAGYIVHDVHETVPFMLLDSIEMIDGRRLVDLVSYLEAYVPFLVVVLLPDHARTFEQCPPSPDYRAVDI